MKKLVCTSSFVVAYPAECFLSQARNYVAPTHSSKRVVARTDKQEETEGLDLGWVDSAQKRKSKKRKSKAVEEEEDKHESAGDEDDEKQLAVQHRQRLLKELSARLARDTQLRYATREFEMQRLMMGKGARKKIRGAEKVEGDDSEEEDEDALDARGGRVKRSVKKVDESTYKPRVYKWRLERKR